MNAISFALILTGVLLNAAAQLLLKAGTNAVGQFAFERGNILPVGWQLATEPHIFGFEKQLRNRVEQHADKD